MDGIARENFDTETVEFYPINLAQRKEIQGMRRVFAEGEEMPCRNTLCKIKLKGQGNE